MSWDGFVIVILKPVPRRTNIWGLCIGAMMSFGLHWVQRHYAWVRLASVQLLGDAITVPSLGTSVVWHFFVIKGLTMQMLKNMLIVIFWDWFGIAFQWNVSFHESRDFVLHSTIFLMLRIVPRTALSDRNIMPPINMSHIYNLIFSSSYIFKKVKRNRWNEL